MVRKFGMAVMVAAGLCFVGSQAMAQDANDFTKDENKCESGAGKALGKQVGAQSKCVDKCVKAQRKLGLSADYSSCLSLAPTDPCITDPLKGSAAKAQASIVKGCTKDCPACYSGTECTNGQPFVSTTQSLVATQGGLVYCVESNGGLNNGVPDKAQAKCEDDTAKNLVKWVGTINKCYGKCTKDAQAAKIPYNACAPALGAGAPPPTDLKLLDCLSKGALKTASAIDKSCSTIPAGCYNAPMGLNGTQWTALVKSLVDGQTPAIACGSPSGAFLN